MIVARAARRLLLTVGLSLGLLIGQTWSLQAAPAVPLPHYDLVVGLDMDTTSLTAREVVRFTNTYGFLAELRRTMGDPAWIRFLRLLDATYADKVESPRAVLDLAQQAAPTTDLGVLVRAYMRYAGVRSDWSVGLPPGPWSGQVSVDVEASFPLKSVELWLDDRQVAVGSGAQSFSVDSSTIPAGEYVLLARVTGVDGAIYERAARVTVNHEPSTKFNGRPRHRPSRRRTSCRVHQALPQRGCLELGGLPAGPPSRT